MKQIFKKNQKNILKVDSESAKHAENKSSIVIGGADLSSLKSKDDIIAERVAEATEIATEKAQEIISNARQQASKIIENAESQREDIIFQAKEQGYQDGQNTALQEVEKKFADQFSLIASILKDIEKERQESLEDQQERIEIIISKMAHKLIKRDLSIDKDLVLEYILSCIKALDNKSMINILCNPEQAEQLNKFKNKIEKELPGIESLTIVAEGKLDHGDLILESNRERLDFRIDSQFEEIASNISS